MSELCWGRKKGVFWKRGLFRTAHFLETLEKLSRSSRESRDYRDASSEKTPFGMTLASGPDCVIVAVLTNLHDQKNPG